MNDRAVTLLGAIVSLCIFTLLVYQPASGPQRSQPTTIDEGDSGYAAAYRWASAEAVPVTSLRKRLTISTLPISTDRPARKPGDVLIMTLPFTNPMRAAEHAHLEKWVRSGNTLFVAAALNDTPAWLPLRNSDNLQDDLETLAGMSFTPRESSNDGVTLRGNPLAPTTIKNTPLGSHPLLNDVDELAGTTPLVSSVWELNEAELDTRGVVIELAADAEYAMPSLWQYRLGRGSVIVGTWASIFSNQMLDHSGNARFFRNLLAYHRSEKGKLIFADYHQGLSELYDPAAFFADQRLHASIWFILAFWLLYLLGRSARLGEPMPIMQPASQIDVVLAFGQLAERKLKATDCARALINAWLRELGVAQQKIDKNVIPWDALADRPLLDGDQVRLVESFFDELAKNRPVSLTQLHNTLDRTRRRLT